MKCWWKYDHKDNAFFKIFLVSEEILEIQKKIWEYYLYRRSFTPRISSCKWYKKFLVSKDIIYEQKKLR